MRPAIAFARQAAREARIAAGGEAAGRATDGEGAPRIAGACLGGPVHFNFPFDEPLKPDLRVEGLFETGRSALNAPSDLRLIHPSTYLDPMDSARVLELLRGRRVLVAAGEGSCATTDEMGALLAWAESFEYPLLADPLSGLRTAADPLVIDRYDTVLGAPADALVPEAVIRFGPLSGVEARHRVFGERGRDQHRGGSARDARFQLRHRRAPALYAARFLANDAGGKAEPRRRRCR